MDLINKNRDLSLAYKHLFNTPQGKEVLKDILKQTKYFDNSADLTNVNKTYYNLGQRAIALHIIKLLNLEESDLIKLMKQSNPINKTGINNE